MSSIILRSEALAVGHAGTPLLRDVSLELPLGAMVAVLGVNGIGKSTLLRTLSGLQHPLGGQVFVNERDVHGLSAMDRARSVGMVLSGRPTIGLLDVRTLVGLGRQPWTGAFGRLRDPDKRIVQGSMDRAGITPLAERQVQELSDGELQLVMIARALAQDTPLLVLDEPTAFLDVINRVKLLQLLRTVTANGDRTVLFSTHDLQLALEASDQMVLIDRERRIWQGTPEAALASGVLERAFAQEGLLFDPVTRSFRFPS
jgi:iron complex transport system ATP-binding protein